MKNKKIYKKPVYWVIYIYIFIALLTLIIFTFIFPVNAFSIHPLMILGIGLQFIPLLLYQLNRHKKRVIISDNSIVLKGLLKTKELKFNEIKGFKKLYWFSRPFLQSHYIIEPINNEKDAIKINLSYQKINELSDWIENNLKNLDSLREATDKKNLLQDSRFGSTTIERQIKISQSKRVAAFLNILGTTLPIILSIILFESKTNLNTNNPYLLFVIVLIPIVSIISIVYFKGLIKLDYIKRTPFFNRKKLENDYSYKEALNKSIYSDVSLAIMIPSLVVGFLAFIDYNILDFSNIWAPALTIASICLVIVLLSSKEFIYTKISHLGKILFYFIMFFVFGYGTTLLLNDKLDTSDTIIYNSTIKKKTVSLGSKKSLIRSQKHKLIIEPWGQYKGRNAQIVKVSEGLYNTKEDGDIIQIEYHKGKFNISWFEIAK